MARGADAADWGRRWGTGRWRTPVRVGCALLAAAASLGFSSSALGATFQASEGASFAGGSVSASKGCSAPAPTVDWGDQGPPSAAVCGPGNNVTIGSHTYGEEGPYNGVVSYNSPNGPQTSPFTVTVTDASLTASSTGIAATPGAPFAGTVAHLGDADPAGIAGDYGATINWGDGTAISAGTVTSAPGGGFTVSGGHTYAAAGSFPLTITATDAGGAGVNASGTATVTASTTTSTSTTAPPPPPPPPARAAFAVSAGAPGHLLADASPSHAPGRSVAAYTWNLDGHVGAHPSASCGGDASQLSARVAPGTHSLALTVTDASGTQTRVIHQVVVPRPAADIAARPARAPALAQVFTCSPGVTDHPGDVTAQGGPPAGCATEVQFGLADAVGCLNALTGRGGWPAAEGKIIHQLSLGVHVCTGCARDAAAGSLSTGQLEGAIAATQDPYFSTGPVRINGIDFIPAPGASILLVPNQNYVISSDATVKLGGVTLKRGLVILYVPQGAGNANRVHIDDYTLSQELQRLAPGIGELPFDGSIGLDFVYHRAQLPVHVKLPDVFSADPGGADPITGAVTLSTDNGHGLLLDAVDITVPEAFLGPLEVDNLFFHYQRDGDIWNGGADVVFPGGSLKATPPPPDNGFGLKGGSFDHAGATLNFAEPIEVFPGVDLTHISFSLGLNPTRFTGGVGIDVVDIVHVDGSLAMVFASSGAPYVFPANAGPGLEPIAGHRVSTTSIAVGGKVSLITPIGDLGLGAAYILYVFPDYLEFGGGFYYDFGAGHLDGHIFGALQPSKKKFDLEGGLHACVDDVGCIGLDAVVSSRGIAGCVDTPLADLGFGDYWGHFPSIYFHGCDIGPYTDRAADGHSRATISAAGSTQFTLGRGLPSAQVKLAGATDAPQVTLTGPHGERMTTPVLPRYVNGPRFTWLRQRVSRTTFIGIAHPAGGTWTLTTLPGSSPITSISHANGLAQPEVHAQVLGHGATRTLAYDVTSLSGRQLTFSEQGAATARVIGHTEATHGRLRFAPGPGPGGHRKIIATITHNGLQIRKLLVTSFVAPTPARPGRPSHLRVARRGGGLTVSWGTASGAARYAVVIALSDGRRVLLLTHRHSVQVRQVGPTVSGSVRVLGLSAANARGSAATLRVSRLHPQRRSLPRLIA